jgi:hypothetical protein
VFLSGGIGLFLAAFTLSEFFLVLGRPEECEEKVTQYLRHIRRVKKRTSSEATEKAQTSFREIQSSSPAQTGWERTVGSATAGMGTTLTE